MREKKTSSPNGFWKIPFEDNSLDEKKVTKGQLDFLCHYCRQSALTFIKFLSIPQSKLLEQKSKRKKKMIDIFNTKSGDIFNSSFLKN